MAEQEGIKEVGFTVDSGLINRLGIELVGKAETAVSELIKNAYDADAKEVTVEFINSDNIGGTLIIKDTGLGMTEDQLINGFMRISSTEKIHNPKSKKYGRTRAGKKGIGRFATQRLGKKLTIISQAENSSQITKITINWDLYASDTDLQSVKFPLVRESVESKRPGTTLIIEDLREIWTKKSIEKIFTHVNSLFQPDYLSDRSKGANIAIKDESTFKFTFIKDGVQIKNVIEDFYDNALAVIEGYVDAKHEGIVSVDSLQLKNEIHLIENVEYEERSLGKNIREFPLLANVRFKAYYFIYEKSKYKNISTNDLNKIKLLSETISGIRLYRNGFRVLPFGEPTDDWVHVNQRYANGSGTNIPFTTKHLFGFVEILDEDKSKVIFEETSSREGLLENEAYLQLINFVYSALSIARTNLQNVIKSSKNQANRKRTDVTVSSDDNDVIDSFSKDVSQAIDNNQEYDDEEKKQKKVELEIQTRKIKSLINENEMLRVLACLGLNIGEFAHEVVQLQNSVYNHIFCLQNKFAISNDIDLTGIINDFDELFGYTNYFGVAVSQNLNREKQPIILKNVIDQFVNTEKNDNIDIEVQQLALGVETIPMHVSEWSSILSNLYSNSKKAIKRQGSKGKILIQIAEENEYAVLLFNDNGDGIKEEFKESIFDAFFTTSKPINFDAPSNEHLIGTGLGLKIVKDIILSNKGKISVVEPFSGFSTCFKISIPQNK